MHCVNPKLPACPFPGRCQDMAVEEEVMEREVLSNPHLAFEKNYPKNIFITLI